MQRAPVLYSCWPAVEPGVALVSEAVDLHLVLGANVDGNDQAKAFDLFPEVL
jgi:hypothetical protein